MQRPFRALLIDDQPWFIAKDICYALGYAHVGAAIQQHVEDRQRDTVVLHHAIRGQSKPTRNRRNPGDFKTTSYRGVRYPLLVSLYGSLKVTLELSLGYPRVPQMLPAALLLLLGQQYRLSSVLMVHRWPYRPPRHPAPKGYPSGSPAVTDKSLWAHSYTFFLIWSPAKEIDSCSPPERCLWPLPCVGQMCGMSRRASPIGP
ncbi:BRO family protein [Cohaesibacter intestini]|uniref:BRO family protein n=1 Tax=Cohaesibacter intestini TaxID=2211145 RepID=UPI000DE8878A